MTFSRSRWVCVGGKTAGAAVLALAMAACASVQQASVPAPAGPSAEAYYHWLDQCLDGLKSEMPAITASADQAASAYMQDGWGIGAYADHDLVGEFNGRAGGLMGTASMKAIAEPGWKGVVLFFPREETLAADLATAQTFSQQGKCVIGFGGPQVRAAAQQAGVHWASFIDTHAAPHGGLFLVNGQWIVPTDPPADIAAVWTWTGEFAAALTRHGKMPPFYQSISVPGAIERNEKHSHHKFEAAAPAPVPAGQLGREYLTQLRTTLALLHQHDMNSVIKVAQEAQAVRRAGHTAHVFAHGHALDSDIGIPHDPGFLHQVNRGLFELKKDPQIAKGDFVFCLGYDRIFEGWYFHEDLQRMRATGATFAWSMTDYNKDPASGPAAIPAGEIIIWQHWKMGDAVVSVPGYDIEILPPSGVIGEAVLWMTESQMAGMTAGTSP